MRKEDMLIKAIQIATEAHGTSLDKGGSLYIMHPLSVMMMAETLDEKIVAVLHDVVEDTSVTLHDLRMSGFLDVVIDAVDALTRIKKVESYEEFINRVSKNELAIKVKLLDIEHNMDLRRIDSGKLTQVDMDRFNKYFKAKVQLTNALHKFEPYYTIKYVVPYKLDDGKFTVVEKTTHRDEFVEVKEILIRGVKPIFDNFVEAKEESKRLNTDKRYSYK